MPRRVVVLGPTALVVVVVALLAATVTLAALGQVPLAATLAAFLVGKVLPIARGRRGDGVRLVTRGGRPSSRERKELP